MLYKKRHREKLLKMARNSRDNNIQINPEDKSISKDSEKKSEEIREIHGYYYDHEKRKYFPTKNTHMQVYSDYLNDKNKKLLSNEKKSEQLSRVNETEGINKKKEKYEKFSLFKIIQDCAKIKTESILVNRNYQKIIKNHISTNIHVEELTNKNHSEKYEFVNFGGIEFLFVLDNSDDKIKLRIFRIKIKKRQSGKWIINTHYSKIITLEYGNKKFTSLKISQSNFIQTNKFLILITNFEIFFVTLKDILLDTSPQVFHINLDKNIKYKNLPQSFDWPLIKQTNKENEFILLFYKSKFNFIYNLFLAVIILELVNFQKEDQVIINPKIFDNIVRIFDIKFDDLFNIRNINNIKIKKEFYFQKESFNNLYFNDKRAELYLCESSGAIHIFDCSLKKIKVINSIKTPIVNVLSCDYSEIMLVQSNSDIDILNVIDYSLTKFYESRIKNSFVTDRFAFVSEKLNLVFFKNEEDKYVCKSLKNNSAEKSEIPKVKFLETY